MALRNIGTFQSTLPRGERHKKQFRFLTYHYFNPRSREGSDINTRISSRLATVISIHAPARGATLTVMCNLPSAVYFNPRSREGSDLSIIIIPFRFVISIHAPARGATQSGIIAVMYDYISIHAPARGATAATLDLIYNPIISIHAPARGATCWMPDSVEVM